MELELRKDSYEGHLFVFVGKRRDKVKVLFWDRGGFALYMKIADVAVANEVVAYVRAGL